MNLTSEQVRSSFKYLYPDELPFLKRLVQSLPDHPVVVNIGAGAGTSGLAILESRKDVTLITVDVTDLSSPFGCLEAERDVVSRAGLGASWGMSWFQYHGPSADFLQSASKLAYLNTRPVGFEMWARVDMVFVDGDHSEEGCASDIVFSVPLIKEGGILAVHDYDKGMLPPHPDGPHPKEWEGVNRAVGDLLLGEYELIGRVDSLIAFRI